METGSLIKDPRPIQLIESAYANEDCDQVVFYEVRREGAPPQSYDCDEITAYCEMDDSIWFAVYRSGVVIDRVNSRDAAHAKYA